MDAGDAAAGGAGAGAAVEAEVIFTLTFTLYPAYSRSRIGRVNSDKTLCSLVVITSKLSVKYFDLFNVGVIVS